MRVIWLYLLFFSVKFTSARYIPAFTARRQGSEPKPDEPVTEEQILYDNMNILRDLTLTTEPIWDFEEVNYDEMIGAIKDEHNDCFGISISCTLTMGHIRPVCGVHNHKQKYYVKPYMEKFASICDMDYRNCLYRINYKNTDPSGVFGVEDKDTDYLEWVQEGYECPDLDRGRPAGK